MKNFAPSFVRIVSLFLFLVSVIGITAQTSNLPALTPKQVAQRTLPSIVILIINNGDSLPVTTGSGFFVAEDTIITNYHVVKNARLGAFKIYGSDEVYSVIGTIGVDSVNDLALLKVKGVKGKPLKLNGAYQLSIGDEVFTASSPKGLEGSFSQGLISGLRKTSKEDLVQITAPISHGSSGGAILNNQAEVIAVAVGGIDEGQSLNFAVPIKYAQALMAKKVSLADLPGKMNNSYGNTPTLSSGIGSGGGQNANPITGIGNGLGSSVKSPAAIINESAIKAPSAVSEIIKSRIPPTVLKPNQFKVSDLVEDNLRGDVFATLTITYKVTPDFDKFIKGEESYQKVTFYNRDGNITNTSSAGLEVTVVNGLSIKHQEAKTIKTYNSTNRTVTAEKHYGQDFFSKEINTYSPKGEQITSNYYNKEGKLDYKETFEYSDLFSKSRFCLTDNGCDTTYVGLDDNGIETIIRYDNKDLASLDRKIKKGNFTVKEISYSFCRPLEEGGIFRNPLYEGENINDCFYNGKAKSENITLYSYDLETNQLINKITQTRDLDNSNKSVSKESYKYEYKYDSKGNWIEKIEKKEVTKFGETYFEPISFIEREIRYYSDPDAKPSVNKKSTVKRKKN